MPVEKIGQRLARHAKSFGGFPPRQAGRLEAGFPDPLRRGASWFVPFRRSVVADQIKVGYVLAVKDENQPPIDRHPHRPLSPCVRLSEDEARSPD
jgi:hypothetical protein